MAKSGPPSDDDRRLAAECLRKRQLRHTTTQAEERAFKRVRAHQEATDRDRHYRNVPKGDYVKLSGRAYKVLDDQAARYNLPLLGETVDLFAALRRFHDLIAEGRFLDDDDLEDAAAEDAGGNLEKLRGEKYLLAKMDRLERERQLVARDVVHETLGYIASRLRDCGERLQRQFGPDALDLLNEAIDETAREVARRLGDDHPPEPEPEP